MRAREIVLVEDHADTRAWIRKALEANGFVVHAVERARDALALAPRRPDLAILDIGPPDGDGVTLCRALRKSGAGDKMPVIFLTDGRVWP